jgi:hypothetical protein
MIMMKSYFLFTAFSTIILFSCSTKNLPDEKPIARVYDQFLYPSDLKDMLSGATTKEDSTNLTHSFTEKWAKKQILLHLAETNLSDENKDVSMELENYKTSLLIYKYQQLFISEKLDTVISDKEFEEYYNAHPNEFELDENTIKALFIQLPKSAPNPEKVKSLYPSSKEKDIKKLDDYCNKYAFKYDDFRDQWISFSALMKMLPTDIPDPETYIKTNNTIEEADTNYFYFVKIKEYQLRGSSAPFEFAKTIMTPIILTKRKIELLNKLENNALKEELNKKNIEIYD